MTANHVAATVVTFDTQGYGKLEVAFTSTNGYADGEVYFAADDLYSTMTAGKFPHPYRGTEFEFEPASRWPGSAHLLRATIPVLIGVAPKG
jgi:hypothetical protein